jgi:hypothetical protein
MIDSSRLRRFPASSCFAVGGKRLRLRTKAQLFRRVALATFCLVLVLFPGGSTTYAKEVFVSPSGSDTTGGGTLQNPWQTIAKAASVISGGDTIILRGGIYTEPRVRTLSGILPSGPSATQYTTIRSYPGEKPVWRPTQIDGNAVALEIGQSTGQIYSNYWFEGFTIDAVNALGSQTGVMLVRAGANVVVTNMVFQNANYHTSFVSALQQGCDAFTIVGNTFLDWASNDDKGHQPHAVYISSANNVVIRGNTFIRNVDNSFVTSSAIHCYRSAGTDPAWGNNVVIEGNTIRSTRYTLSIHNLYDGAIRNNVLIRTTDTGPNLQFFNSKGIAFDNNTVYGGREGVFMNQYGSTPNHVFRNNIIWGQSSSSVLIHETFGQNTFWTNNIIELPIRDLARKFVGEGNLVGALYDPHFAVPGMAFELRASSAARNAGINLSEFFTSDHTGLSRRRTGAWDIGAHAFLEQVLIDLQMSAGQVESPMTISGDALAPQTLGTSSAPGYLFSPVAGRGSVRFQFEAPTAGDYVVWCRMLAPSGFIDSVYVAVNEEEPDLYYPTEGADPGTWHWSRVNGANTGVPYGLRIFSLQQGVNTLTFSTADPFVSLSRVLVTDDLDFVPEAGVQTRRAMPPVSMERIGQDTILRWLTVPGQNYHVFYKDDLSEREWRRPQPLSFFRASSTVTEWLDRVPNAHRFYFVYAAP